jgi:hydroxymethylpyrimidine/phosphomethylpyrimidine kinase
MDSVLSDLGTDVFKTGMLPNAATVECVADRIRAHVAKSTNSGGSSPSIHVVVDPVLVSTSGHALGDSSVAQALKSHLFPITTLLTPNLLEASALLGTDTADQCR